MGERSKISFLFEKRGSILSNAKSEHYPWELTRNSWLPWLPRRKPFIPSEKSQSRSNFPPHHARANLDKHYQNRLAHVHGGGQAYTKIHSTLQRIHFQNH
ncbi:hypothetical protein NPIL_374561 [Nephila pilipes]|uniref:Uncharacterized protein n=1 Tax=Nephila pilipes TaxID=299642 RepID=A0A8X6TC23_NEPPI|nr:hypothetical protein NPIL_374561 [Nephila pilipes]